MAMPGSGAGAAQEDHEAAELTGAQVELVAKSGFSLRDLVGKPKRCLALLAVPAILGLVVLGAVRSPRPSEARAPGLEASTLFSEMSTKTLCKKIWKQAVKQEVARQKLMTKREDKEWWANTGGLPVHKQGIAVMVGKCGTPTTLHEMKKAGMWEWFQWMHVHPVRPEHMNFTDFTVLARDPVSRTRSAFAWMYSKYGKPPDSQLPFYDCFPNFEAFAQNMDKDTKCGKMARSSLWDLSIDRGHINRGMCFYLGGYLEALERKRVHVLRTENHRDDFNQWANDYGRPSLSEEFVVHEHDNSGQTGINTDLSEEGRRILVKYLDFEYYAYHKLLKLGGHKSET